MTWHALLSKTGLIPSEAMDLRAPLMLSVLLMAHAWTMTRIVDASALLDCLLPTDRQDAALAALIGHDLWAPTILDLEVTSALWRLVRVGSISDNEADHARVRLREAPIRRLAHAELADLAWRMRHSVRISDGFYVAAARILGADLLTSDARLSRAPLLGVTVTLLR